MRKETLAVAHRWVRRFFLVWAVVSTSWLANTFRTRGVDEALLQSDSRVVVVSSETTLGLESRSPQGSRSALVFFCGAGVSARAYVPLLRPLAEAGHSVWIVRLPFRLAPLESHKQEALARARRVIDAHPEVSRWVVSGHSLGAALAARLVDFDPAQIDALVLIGTTHPKERDLSQLGISVVKVYGTHDGVAPIDRMFANRGLLPKSTRWVEISGGNHSQFGHYGHQLFDGTATVSRLEQQKLTRDVLLEALAPSLDAAASPQAASQIR